MAAWPFHPYRRSASSWSPPVWTIIPLVITFVILPQHFVQSFHRICSNANRSFPKGEVGFAVCIVGLLNNWSMTLATVTRSQINDLSLQPRHWHLAFQRNKYWHFLKRAEMFCPDSGIASLIKTFSLAVISSTITPAAPHTAGFMRLLGCFRWTAQLILFMLPCYNSR